MHKHYVKEIFNELWDSHQVSVVSKCGGNYAFFMHLQRVGLENTKDIKQRYEHPGVKKYKKKLIAVVMGKTLPASSSSSKDHKKQKKAHKQTTQ